jgi:holo-[acyl-carrier protein] synthase
MRMPMTWRLCEVGKLPSGQPVIVLHGELKAWFEAKGLSAHITVTDESEYAASFCVVETCHSRVGREPLSPPNPEPLSNAP